MSTGWRKILEGLFGLQAAPVAEALLQPRPDDRVIVSLGWDLPEPEDEEPNSGYFPQSDDNPAAAFVGVSPSRLRHQLSAQEHATAFIGPLPVPMNAPAVTGTDALLVVAEAVAAADGSLKRAVVGVPTYVAWSAKMLRLRAGLVDLVQVTHLVRVPSSAGMLDQPIVLLRLEPKAASVVAPTRFYSLTRDPRQGTRLAEQLCESLESTTSSEVFSAILPRGEPWVEEALHPERMRLLAAADSSTQNRRLRELAEVSSGRAAPRDGPREPTLVAKAISELLPEAAELALEPVSGRPTRVRTGDIVGRDMRPYAWAVVPAELDGVVAGNGTLVIRPGDAADAEYLVSYLRSAVASRMLPTSGTVMPRLRRGDLEDLPIPYLDKATARQAARHAETVVEARRQVLRVVEELDAAIEDGFGVADGGEVAVRLAQAAERAKVTAQSLLRHDEPAHSYQDVYPHPVARALRQTKIVDDPLQRHDAVVRAGEVLITTLAAVAAAGAVAAGIRVPPAAEWLAALNRQGLSSGHWLQLLRAAGEACRRADNDPVGVGEATRSRRNRGLLPDLEALLEVRNAVAHRRGPRTAAAAAEQLPELESRLMSALASSALLGDIEWVLVQRADWDRRQGRYIVNALSLMGDHPDFERAQFNSREPLQPGLLYARGRPHAPLLLLDPFVALLDCPFCQNAEVYFPDRRQGGGTRLMNITTSHVVDSERIARDVDIAIAELGGPRASEHSAG